LRIGVKKGGCAGMEYTMDYARNQPDGRGDRTGRRAGDDRAHGADVPLRDRDRLRDLALESGFKFNNPNVAEACGCGESIKFKDIDELQATQAGTAS
jgi:iron-sulfur cluster assembly protein